MHRVFRQQVLLDARRTGVVQVQLAGLRRFIGLKRANDGVFALVECGLAGFALLQGNQHLMVTGFAVALDLGVLEPGTIHGTANLTEVGSIGELHVHQRAALEVHSEGNTVPEENREQPSNAEDQGEGKKIPLLAQEIDISVTK
jgi:hypothetical protein